MKSVIRFWFRIALILLVIIALIKLINTYEVRSKTNLKQFEGPIIFDSRFDEADSLQKWNLFNKSWPYGNQLQYYSPDNVYLKNGELVIETDKDRVGGKEYVSGRVDTRNKFSFTYGVVEFRAKFPSGQGIYPALWLKPVNHPVYPEIDVLEFNGRTPFTAHMAFHAAENGVDTNVGKSVDMPFDLTKGYHTYAIVWTKQSITWFIDGIRVYYTDKYVPNQPMYLTINTAVGGLVGAPSSETVFPAFLKVQYVRVYALKNTNSDGQG